MADIRFSGAGAISVTHQFESDEDLSETLIEFAECINDGNAGMWLATTDNGMLWLPTNVPLLASFDSAPDEDLLDRLTNATSEDPGEEDRQEPFVIG